ncbi:hypothetical protein C2E23DRAFT_701885, partial [Lenzites betulinus]
GPSVPRRDRENDKERYCRLMLILFKPWKEPANLLEDSLTWQDTFERYHPSFSELALEVMNNLQLLHECKDSRND